MARGGAVQWLFYEDEDDRWHANATVDDLPKDLVTDIRNGVVAVDRNVDHLAIAFVDRSGNYLERRSLPFPVVGTPEGVASSMIGDAVRTICDWAVERNYGVAVEDLSFDRKKAALKEFGKAHARRLSGFAYSKFDALLASRASRFGVDVHAVNPAYTTVIGRKKYARTLAMSAHHAAALVIGRRAMGFGERFVCMDGVALDGPARNRTRHLPSRWRTAHRRLQSTAGASQDASRPRARSVRGTRRASGSGGDLPLGQPTRRERTVARREASTMNAPHQPASPSAGAHIDQ
jgi:IS605 OrfB family transposase